MARRSYRVKATDTIYTVAAYLGIPPEQLAARYPGGFTAGQVVTADAPTQVTQRLNTMGAGVPMPPIWAGIPAAPTPTPTAPPTAPNITMTNYPNITTTYGANAGYIPPAYPRITMSYGASASAPDMTQDFGTRFQMQRPPFVRPGWKKNPSTGMWEYTTPTQTNVLMQNAVNPQPLGPGTGPGGAPGNASIPKGYVSSPYTIGGVPAGTATPGRNERGQLGYNVPQPRYFGQENPPMGFVASRGYIGRPYAGEYSGFVPGTEGRAGYYVGYDPRTGTRTPTRGAKEYEWFDTTAPELRWVWGY